MLHSLSPNNDAELQEVREFQQAMRFTDLLHIVILKIMRPGGRALSDQQWQALKNTDVRAEQPDIPATWYHSGYCWSVMSPAKAAKCRALGRHPSAAP